MLPTHAILSVGTASQASEVITWIFCLVLAKTTQHFSATAGSSLTMPLALAGSRLQENVYMFSCKNPNPKKTQGVPAEEIRVRVYMSENGM